MKLEVNTGTSKSSNIWILTATCLDLRTCTVRAITFPYTQITLHMYIRFLSYCCLLYVVVIQGVPSKNDNLVSHGICRMVEDSPRDEIHLDE